MFFAGHYNNLNSNLDQRCSAVRLKVLEYIEAQTIVRGSGELLSALEDTLWQIHKCFVTRLDYTVAFTSLVNAVWQRGDLLGKSGSVSFFPFHNLVKTVDNLLENAAQLETVRDLHRKYTATRTRLGLHKDRYTQHLYERLISAVGMLGAFPEASHWAVTTMANLRKAFGLDTGVRPGVGAPLKLYRAITIQGHNYIGP